MKLIVRTLSIVALASFTLFSCKGLESPIGKVQLDEKELQEVVFQLDEYATYVEAFFEMEKQQKARENSLSNKDKQWLKSMAEKYPDHDVLFEKEDPATIKRYNYLTGRDLYHENSSLSKRFNLLTEKLDQNYVYDKMDLADLLIPYTTK